jgi:hypothetical protein
MFTVALFTIAKLWNQLRCPSTDEYVRENTLHMHNGVYYSAIKNQSMWFVGKWMELEIILNELRQTEKEKHHIFSHAKSRT